MAFTNLAPVRAGLPGEPAPAPVLDVVIPVYNEEIDLEPCVRRLHAHLSADLPYTFRITVADNASTDTTLEVAQRLAREYPHVRVVHLAEKGRGRALRQVWLDSDAAVLAYMDVDLSTDLAGLLPLIAPLVSGHSDVAIGTRLHRGSRVVRGAKREFISRSYNLMLRHTLSTKFTDAQCGFKAIRRDVAQALLPHVEDNAWFFDTELLVLTERAGLRIHEVPVDWIDDPGSTVHIYSTARDDIRGIIRIGRAFAAGRIPLHDLSVQLGRSSPEPRTPGVPVGLTRQLVRFAGVGVLSTLAYIVLFLGLHSPLGAQGANAAALLITAIGNTALNRRFTFGVRGRNRNALHQAQGLIVFALALALTSGTLLALHTASDDPGRNLELAVTVAANAVATLMRFLLLRRWVFRAAR
ncbi:bifunctional glycosyltransferase family 2/GtrA family protein [Sporichthya sp.]|uniref:bifunctional glycosyltransferase family 2/GtrA family protein n=1 Tax=Sporichthya sp. TaxID=65475 RepID=UPI0018273A29|nr:bifunctional glycosyltransferase family 2/GtrA family protein [Sporichthya sp.]MBA3743256.1 bifunctional glycosyltransferase family 2/GtrA family protein [Sporichthya sp.]